MVVAVVMASIHAFTRMQPKRHAPDPAEYGSFYRVHTNYGVYAPDAARVTTVRNAVSTRSEESALVSLSPGKYSVEGWADRFELVKVPVEIEAGHVTVVNLEACKNRRFAGAKSDELVRTPNGLVIGWAARLTANR